VTPTTEGGQTLAYQVEGVGVVTLMRTADTLSVISIDVDPQWDAAQSSAADGVSIRFASSSQVIAFSASIVDGQVVVDVVDETPAPVTGSYDDDDHGSESQSYDDDEGSYDDD
jgi:cystathionine beta-lyase family protein involved in aluminum resistance